LCSFADASQTTTRWNVYTVDADMKQCLSGLQMASCYSVGGKPRGKVARHSGSKTVIVVSLLDSDGQIVTEDEFELVADVNATFSFSTSPDARSRLPLLRHFVVRDLRGKGALLENDSRLGVEDERGFLASSSNQYTANFYVAPFAFTVKGTGYGISFCYQPRQTFERRIKATLDELKRIASVQCKVSWRPGIR
jgi:hypothetical protein